MPQEAKTGSGASSPVGSGEHEVQPGECCISIADAAGHFWETVWNHPDNRDVKNARGSPHVLLAGDRLHVPEIEPKDESAATEKRHRYRRKGIPITFEIVVKENGKPLEGLPYVLVIEGRSTSGTVPKDGKITAPMFPKDRTGELRVGEGDTLRIYPLDIGGLDPAHTRTGCEARLANLGLLGEGADDETFAQALKKFQSDNGLNASGELDNDTAKKLAEVHGS